MIRLASVASLWLALVSASPPQGVAADLITGDALPPKLSDFRFFTGVQPNARVTPYHLNTPLFSDYTDKDRFVFVPAGQTAHANGDGLIDFPVGSAFIKTFRYGARKIETRLLLHRPSGWVALPYVWNVQGTEAMLMRSGTRVDAVANGEAISYKIPNVNQCKECHALSGAVVPIGPKARNIDGAQLATWRQAGLIQAAPDGLKIPRWDDSGAPLDGRARAYLDVNCGHCHNPKGAASNSGLFLTWQETDPTARGIGKRPVAAGRGSGGRDFAIDPGHPERSILIFRMESTEPGVAMPELGRATVHKEAVAMLSAWINEMPAR
ncbi:MAG: hypothetical protein H0X36_07635 [Sphingomonadaceae bacterium]|nr:hypothetical protein [Sphingomonadaceae bacterium]